MRRGLRPALAGLLLGCVPALAGASGPLAELYGRVVVGASVVVGRTTALVADTLNAVAQLLPAPLEHTIVRLQGRYLVLAAGTAAMTLGYEHEGRTRSAVLIRPDPELPGAPLLVMLHGNSGTPQNQANMTNVAEHAATRGWWVLLPEAIDGVWEDDPSSDDSGKDDAAFVAGLAEAVAAEFALDAQRIYATGMSNGGFMVQRLICEHSGRFAAAGVVSAGLREGLARSCAQGVPRPIAFIVGTLDPLVPYDGLYPLRSAQQTLEFWARRNGCEPASLAVEALPDLERDRTSVELSHYRDCSSGRPALLYSVLGGGHAWPGGWQYLPVPIVGTTSRDIDATSLLMDFFEPYTR